MTKARDLANAGTALTTVSATELGYVDGVTSAIQTQLDAKIPKTLTTTTGDIIYASGANTPARLGIGSTDQVLKVSGGVPTWATASSGSLTKISKQTFTSSSAVNVNSVFSATYTNYFLLCELTNSTSNVDTLFKLRASGSNSSTSYSLQGYLSQGSNVTAESFSTGFPIIRAGSTTLSFGKLDLFNPFVAAHTGFVGLSGGSHGYAANLNGRHTSATSYDGFSLSVGSGTITGTVTIYGYEA